MSQRFTDHGTTYEIYAGTRENFTTIIDDPSTGEAIDLTDADVYTTGTVRIFKPDGTLIGTTTVDYVTRSAGLVDWEIDSTIASNANAGNWTGNLILYNTLGNKITQRFFNFNIIETY